MKVVHSVLVAALVSIPVFSFVQGNHALTPADAHEELVQLQKAGYKPVSDNTQCPENIEAAEARIAARNGSVAATYGGVEQSRSAAESRSTTTRKPTLEQDVGGLDAIYTHS